MEENIVVRFKVETELAALESLSKEVMTIDEAIRKNAISINQRFSELDKLADNVNKRYKERNRIVSDGTKTLEDQTTELARQTVVLNQLADQFANVAKFKDGILINPNEVKKASESIENQKQTIEALEKSIVSMVDQQKKVVSGQEDIVDSEKKLDAQTKKTNKTFSGFIKNLKSFGKAGVAGAIALIANELRKVSPVAEQLEGLFSGVSAAVNAAFSGDNIEDAFLDGQRASNRLNDLRREEIILQTEISRNNDKIIAENSIINSVLSTRQQRENALLNIQKLESKNIENQINLLRRRESEFKKQNRSQIKNGSIAELEGLQSIRSEISTLEDSLLDLEIQTNESVLALFGVTDVEKITATLEDLRNQILQTNSFTVAGGIAAVDTTNIDRYFELITAYREESEKLRVASIDEQIALAANQLERLGLIAQKYQEDIQIDISNGLEVSDIAIESLQKAEDALEDINNAFAEVIADGTLEKYIAQIETLETSLERALGEENVAKAQELAKEIRALQLNLQTSQEGANPFLEIDKTLEDQIFLEETGVQLAEDRINRISQLENQAQQKRLIADFNAIKDSESLAAKEIINQLEVLERDRLVLQEEFRDQRLQREVGYMQQIGELGGQLTEIIIDAEVDRLDRLIELQEGRVAEALSIADEGASKQLQLEEERLSALNEERQKALEKRAAIDKVAALAEIAINTSLILSNLAVLAAKSSSGSVFAAPIVVPALLALVSGIIGGVGVLYQPPAFFEGTDYDVQTSLGYKPGKDSHVVRVHNTERIVSEKYNKEFSHLSTEEFTDFARKGMQAPPEIPMYDYGFTPQMFMPQVPLDVIHGTDKVRRITEERNELKQHNHKLTKSVDKMTGKLDDISKSMAALGIEVNVTDGDIVAMMRKKVRREDRKKKRLS